jgi:hypothetical protein
VACHECNSSKQGAWAEDFLRSLYREGTLSKSDLKNRLQMLGRLQEGTLLPTM